MSSYSCSHDYASKHVFSCDHSLVTTEHWNIRKLSWAGQWMLRCQVNDWSHCSTPHWSQDWLNTGDPVWPALRWSSLISALILTWSPMVVSTPAVMVSGYYSLLHIHYSPHQHCYCHARHDDKIFNCCFFKYFLNTDERRKSWSQVYTYTLSLFEWLWAEELKIDPIGSSLSRWIQSSWLLSILLFRIPLTTHTHSCDCMTLQSRAC